MPNARKIKCERNFDFFSFNMTVLYFFRILKDAFVLKFYRNGVFVKKYSKGLELLRENS